MEYRIPEVRKAASLLKKKFEELADKRAIMRAPELAALYDRIKELPAGKARADFGKEVNQLKKELEDLILKSASSNQRVKSKPIDITAPFDINTSPENRPA